MPQMMALLLCLRAAPMPVSLQCNHCLPTNAPMLNPSTDRSVTPAYYWEPWLGMTMPSAYVSPLLFSRLNGAPRLLPLCQACRPSSRVAAHGFPMSMINSVFTPQSPQEHQTH